MGLLDPIQRYGEPALSVATGAAVEPLAGWYGLLGGGADGINKLRQMGTYQPRTAAGKQGANKLAELLMAGKSTMVDNNPPVKAIVDGYENLADMAGQYNPLLGALLETFPAAASMMTAGPARGALGSAGRSLAPKAGQMAENYMRKTGGLLDVLPPEVFRSLVEKANRGEKLSVTERVMLQNHRSDMMGDLSDTIQPPPAKPVQRQGQ